MNEQKKLFTIFLVLIIIIISGFVAVMEYRFGGIIKDDELSLTVKIFASQNDGVVPLEINFSSIVTNYEGTISYNWDFGDGNTSKERNPTTMYMKNGTFTCNLNIRDEEGDKASDSIKIFAKKNSPPTLSIEADDRPRRPENFLMEFVLDKFLYIETYGGKDYRWLRDRGYLDKFFEQESFLTVEAIGNDPDGDEIVSYNWTLKPPGYTTRIGNKPMEPEYHYYGKKVDIPTKDIYPAHTYSLACTVTDSTGQKRSEKIEFNVLKSLKKENRESQVRTIEHYINQWINKMRDSKIMGPLGKAIFALITLKLLSKLPAVKLITIIILDFVLQTPPKDSTDGKYDSYMGPLKDLTDNRTWAYNLVNRITYLLQKQPDLGQSFAEFFGARDIEHLREYLGFENKRPIVSNPSPQDGAMLVDLNTSKLWISVLDDIEENDRFNVSIYSEYINTTDHYVNYTNVNNSDGPFSAPLITPLPPSTEIEWRVTVVEPDYVKDDPPFIKNYKFTTAYE